jgi:hypothetical protein
MNWEQLLSLKRQGDTGKRLRIEQDETRLGFEVDYDRIIFSSAFRSLQDKTQVIPLSKTDFVHTRLTHSLEVSVVGRSLGRLVGKKIIEKYPYLQDIHGYQMNDFGAIVAAASLAHDIGNPPFGHSGEKAIGEYFSIGKGQQYKNQLSPKQWQDLVDFEGNANGFSVLNSSRPGVEGGIRLSFATLGAFMKYPKESLPKKPTKNIADIDRMLNDNNLFSLDRKSSSESIGGTKIDKGTDIALTSHPSSWTPMIFGICPGTKCPDGRENRCSLCPYLITGKIFLDGVIHQTNLKLIQFYRLSREVNEEENLKYENSGKGEQIQLLFEEISGWFEIINKIENDLYKNNLLPSNTSQIIGTQIAPPEISYLKTNYDAFQMGVEKDNHSLELLTINAFNIKDNMYSIDEYGRVMNIARQMIDSWLHL